MQASGVGIGNRTPRNEEATASGSAAGTKAIPNEGDCDPTNLPVSQHRGVGWLARTPLVHGRDVEFIYRRGAAGQSRARFRYPIISEIKAQTERKLLAGSLAHPARTLWVVHEVADSRSSTTLRR